jgi:hypothetical protein
VSASRSGSSRTTRSRPSAWVSSSRGSGRSSNARGPRRASMRTPRSACCTSVPCSASRVRPTGRDGTDRARRGRPRPRTGRGDVGRARRRQGPGAAARAVLRARDHGRLPRVKAIFDPDNRHQPGQHRRARADRVDLMRTLRVRPTKHDDDHHPRSPRRTSSYDDQTDFVHAVEMCNGAGVCRKKTGGRDVPQLHGHARRAALDARAGQRAAARDHRAGRTWRSRVPTSWDAPRRTPPSTCASRAKPARASARRNVDVARLKAEYTPRRTASGAGRRVRCACWARCG